jgi:hypothetical protein
MAGPTNSRSSGLVFLAAAGTFALLSWQYAIILAAAARSDRGHGSAVVDRMSPEQYGNAERADHAREDVGRGRCDATLAPQNRADEGDDAESCQQHGQDPGLGSRQVGILAAERLHGPPVL